MPTINLTKKSPTYDIKLNAYSMTVEVSSSEGIEKEVFVKQKLVNFLNDQVEEVFVAICSPTQMEDLPKLAPTNNSSYFRASKISLVANTAEHLQAIFDTLLYELHKLTVDIEVLADQAEETHYTITPSGAVEQNAP